MVAHDALETRTTDLDGGAGGGGAVRRQSGRALAVPEGADEVAGRRGEERGRAARSSEGDEGGGQAAGDARADGDGLGQRGRRRGGGRVVGRGADPGGAAGVGKAGRGGEGVVQPAAVDRGVRVHAADV